MKLKVSVNDALSKKQLAERRKLGLADDIDQNDQVPERRKSSDSLLPPLRHFKEGRYEEVLLEFEKKQARKAGVAVEEPSSLKKKRKQRRKLRKAVRHFQKRGILKD